MPAIYNKSFGIFLDSDVFPFLQMGHFVALAPVVRLGDDLGPTVNLLLHIFAPIVPWLPKVTSVYPIITPERNAASKGGGDSWMSTFFRVDCCGPSEILIFSSCSRSSCRLDSLQFSKLLGAVSCIRYAISCPMFASFQLTGWFSGGSSISSFPVRSLTRFDTVSP